MSFETGAAFEIARPLGQGGIEIGGDTGSPFSRNCNGFRVTSKSGRLACSNRDQSRTDRSDLLQRRTAGDEIMHFYSLFIDREHISPVGPWRLRCAARDKR